MNLPSENKPGQPPFPNNRMLVDPIGHDCSIEKKQAK